MTCIVGIQKDGEVYLGGDSAGVHGGTYEIESRTHPKVFANEEFVMGFTSSFRMGQLLQYGFTPPEHSPRKDDMKYLVCDFVDAIRELYKQKGYLEKHNEIETGGIFLLGYRGKLYKIEDDFQVGHVTDGFSACGCGSHFALGSLYTTAADDLEPAVKLHMALQTATKFSAGVRGPFSYVSTKKDFKYAP